MITIITRYSVVTKKLAASWAAGRGIDFEKYKESILNPRRMSIREKLFSGICLESIVGQSHELNKENFRFIVVTSDLLPQKNLSFLKDLLLQHEWAHLEIVPAEGGGRHINSVIVDFLNFRPTKNIFQYATLRLDDDDGISRNFLRRISAYLEPQYDQSIISFPDGFCGLFNEDNHRFTRFSELHHPKVSAGMAMISSFDPINKKIISPISNIYDAGNHMKVDEKHRVISEPGQFSYIRSLFESQDSATTSLQQFDELRTVGLSTVCSFVKISEELAPKFPSVV